MATQNSGAAWAAVAQHAQEMKSAHLRDLAADPDRWRDFHVEWGPWLLDMSRQRVTRKTLPLLLGSRARFGPRGRAQPRCFAATRST